MHSILHSVLHSHCLLSRKVGLSGPPFPKGRARRFVDNLLCISRIRLCTRFCIHQARGTTLWRPPGQFLPKPILPRPPLPTPLLQLPILLKPLLPSPLLPGPLLPVQLLQGPLVPWPLLPRWGSLDSCPGLCDLTSCDNSFSTACGASRTGHPIWWREAMGGCRSWWNSGSKAAGVRARRRMHFRQEHHLNLYSPN